MAISQTFTVLKYQIADELGNRTDLLAPLSGSSLTLSPIENAIASAIAKWEREPFYFNEKYNSATPFFTTVAGQEFYTESDSTAIVTSPAIYSLHVLIAANRYPMEKRTWQELEDISMNPAAREQPSDWAYLARTIRLYPIPDRAYPIRASRLRIVTNEFILDESLLDGPDVLAPADASAWTIEGYDLIRCEAKLILATEVLNDDDLARRMKIAIYGDPSLPQDRGYLYALKAETTRRVASGRVRATSF